MFIENMALFFICEGRSFYKGITTAFSSSRGITKNVSASSTSTS